MRSIRWWGAVAIAACGGQVGDAGRDASSPRDDATVGRDVADGGTSPDASTVDATVPGTDAADAADAGDANDTSWCPDGSLFDASLLDAGAPWGFSDHPNAFHGLARDPANNVYIGGPAAYLAKLDVTGQLVWSKTYGTGSTYALPRTVDAWGNVLFVGTADGAPISFGGASIPAGSSFVVKLDPNGKFVSQIVFPGGNSYAYPRDIGFLSNGDLVVAGVFNGMINLGGNTLSAATNSVFLVRYDTCGNHVFSKSWTASTEAVPYGLVVDSKDEIVLTGLFVDTIDFGGGTLTSPNNNDWDIWIAKLTANGAHVASRELQGTGADNEGWPALDANDNVILSGAMGGDMDFGAGTVSTNGSRDVFVAKLTPNLGYLWAKHYGDAEIQWASRPAITQGNIAITGYFQGTIDLGKGMHTAPDNGSGTFVATIDPSGNTISSVASVAPQFASSGGICIVSTTTKDVVIAGDYGSAFQLGPKTFPTLTNDSAGFVLRFAP